LKNSVVRWVLRALAAIALLALAWLLLSPTGHYLARAGWEEGKILARRRPITTIVADTTVDPATRGKLQLVLDARTFAANALGLRAGGSFTTFSPLEHDTLVLVLSAAYRDRLQSYRWWFPIVGYVPYKGYFDFGEAHRAEDDFRARGFDTYLRPASAFSTLGFLSDPLVSTTLRADSLSLANTVIHELTHNTYYASGKAEFNESFASFVGARGSQAFFRARGQPRAVSEADARWSDDKVLAQFWKQLHHDIDSTFRAHPGDSQTQLRIALRDSIYRAARTILVFRIGPQLRTVSPMALERARLDNAALLARRVYFTDLDVFDAVLAREQMDLRSTIRQIIALARAAKGDPYDAIRAWLLSGAGRASLVPARRVAAAAEAAAQ
jgi:predicted aminopeptidase